MAAVQALKIEGLKMKTSNIQMEVIQSRQEKMDKLPTILGYRVRYTFTVLVENNSPEKLAQGAGRVLETALENGANAVQQIEIFKKDTTEIRREALSKATAEALANARALARGADKSIVDILGINGTPEYSYRQSNPTYNTAQPAVFGDGASPVVAGDVEVTCRVNVTCLHD
jgi:uncharacterized protein YggE